MGKSVKCCWIHIGMPKTGTTSLQRTLSKLDIPRWSYLRLGPYVNNLSAPFLAMFHPQPQKHHWFRRKGLGRAEIKRKASDWMTELTEFLSRKHDNLLISGEAIPLIPEEGIRQLKNFLEPYCDEIKIIAYARPPVAFLGSMLQQHIKNGHTDFRLSDREILYRDRFEKFDLVFGKENVVFWKFDPINFPKKCLVTDFCQRLGMPLPDDVVERANESLTREAFGLLFAYRKFGPGYGVGNTVIRENISLIEALYCVPGGKLKFGRQLLANVLEYRQDDIAWMERRLGESLAEKEGLGEEDIGNESELLDIDGETCQEFAKCFEKSTGLDVSSFVPPGKNIDPRDAAVMLENCRDVFRSRLIESGSVDSTGKSEKDQREKRRSQSPSVSMQGQPSTKMHGSLVKLRAVAAHSTGADIIDKHDETRPRRKNVDNIVARTYAEIQRTISNASDGEIVTISGLGRFRVRDIKKSRKGKDVVVRRAIFTIVPEK